MSREYFADLEARLRDGAADGVRVARYRISWRSYEALSAGVRDNALAGVYTPMRAEKGVIGGFLLEWSDGWVSHGNLDGASLDNFDEVLAAAAQGRRDDPDAAVFPGPTEVEEVPLHSEDVVRLVEANPEPLAALAKILAERGRDLGAKNSNAGTSAGHGLRGVWTSEGMRLEEPYTTYTFWSWLDGEVGDGFGWRKRYSLEEVGDRLELHDALFCATREERPWGTARESVVVLHPHATGSFVDHFLLTNLSGSGVFHGQSRWKPDDFGSGETVFREDLTLSVAPHVPYHIGSYAFTGEGVISRPTEYITGGRLAEPILDLKYARRMGRPATTPPRTDESLRLGLSRTQTWEECLAGAGEGVLVTGALGMHTQDPMRGDYSLAVPTAIRIEGGRLHGKCRVVLNDNFFQNLSAADLTAVQFPHHDLPGLAFRSTVAPDKG